VPHFLALYEKRIPVVVVRVGAEDPVVSLRGRKCHRGFESDYTRGVTKKRNKMCELAAFRQNLHHKTENRKVNPQNNDNIFVFSNLQLNHPR
jgi:hypothetical protein